MTASFIVNNGEVTVRFEYTAATDKVSDTVNASSEWLYNHGYELELETPFDELTNNQKLAILDAYILDTIRETAKAQRVAAAVDAARETAIEESGTVYI